MERLAKKENRTISKLVHEPYRRYISDEARLEFGGFGKSTRASCKHSRFKANDASDGC
jgi:hypothetical protein